jgi:hypothetical protein
MTDDERRARYEDEVSTLAKITDCGDDGRLLTAYERALRRQRAERINPQLAIGRAALDAAEAGDASQLFEPAVLIAFAHMRRIVGDGFADYQAVWSSEQGDDVFCEALWIWTRPQWILDPATDQERRRRLNAIKPEPTI